MTCTRPQAKAKKSLDPWVPSTHDPKRHSCTATHVVSAHDFADALCTFAKVLPSPLVLSESFSRIFSASNIFAGACSGATGDARNGRGR